MRYLSSVSIDALIGENVHVAMWRQRVSAKELAAEMHISQASLNRKIRGDVVWMARDIEAAARVLDVQPGELFTPTHRYLSAEWALAA